MARLFTSATAREKVAAAVESEQSAGPHDQNAAAAAAVLRIERRKSSAHICMQRVKAMLQLC